MIEKMPKVKSANTVIIAQKILHNSFSQALQEKLNMQNMAENARQMQENLPYWVRGK